MFHPSDYSYSPPRSSSSSYFSSSPPSSSSPFPPSPAHQSRLPRIQSSPPLQDGIQREREREGYEHLHRIPKGKQREVVDATRPRLPSIRELFGDRTTHLSHYYSSPSPPVSLSVSPPPFSAVAVEEEDSDHESTTSSTAFDFNSLADTFYHTSSERGLWKDKDDPYR